MVLQLVHATGCCGARVRLVWQLLARLHVLQRPWAHHN
jgi:hypothetical protein